MTEPNTLEKYFALTDRTHIMPSAFGRPARTHKRPEIIFRVHGSKKNVAEVVHQGGAALMNYTAVHRESMTRVLAPFRKSAAMFLAFGGQRLFFMSNGDRSKLLSFLSSGFAMSGPVETLDQIEGHECSLLLDLRTMHPMRIQRLAELLDTLKTVHYMWYRPDIVSSSGFIRSYTKHTGTQDVQEAHFMAIGQFSYTAMPTNADIFMFSKVRFQHLVYMHQNPDRVFDWRVEERVPVFGPLSLQPIEDEDYTISETVAPGEHVIINLESDSEDEEHSEDTDSMEEDLTAAEILSGL